MFVGGIILSILVLISLTGFLLYKKFSKSMMIVILFLNSIGAVLTAQIMLSQGSSRVYLIYYLIGFLYLMSILFILLVRSGSTIKNRLKPQDIFSGTKLIHALSYIVIHNVCGNDMSESICYCQSLAKLNN
jgi:hypothetical protein